MKKLFLVILFLFTGSIIAQVSTPKSWTANYRFKQYAQGANASADSLNHNWTLADTYIKLAYDSAQAKGSKLGTNVWTGSNTFSGATVLNSITTTAKNIIPIVGGFDLGSWDYYWDRIFVDEVVSNNIWVYNAEQTDSAYFSLNDSVISFSKPISFTASVLLPTEAATLGDDTHAFEVIYADTIISGESYLSLQGKQGGVEFADVFGFGDLSTQGITAATTTVNATGLSMIELTESEAVTGLHTFTAGATRREGGILVVTNASNYNVTLKHGAGNMILGADLILGQYDNATFVYYDIGGGSMRWLCIGNRNN